MSLLLDRSKRVSHVKLAAHRDPAVGDAERILTGGALEQRRQMRERLDLAAVLLPALHRAEVQPQREGGIRRLRWRRRSAKRARAIFSEPAVHRAFHLVLVALAHRARLGVHARASSIIGSCEASTAAAPPVPQLLAHLRVGELRAVHQLARRACRASPWPAAGAPPAHPGPATRACARARRTGSASPAPGTPARGASRRCCTRGSAASLYSRSRSVLGLARSAAPRTSVRA